MLTIVHNLTQLQFTGRALTFVDMRTTLLDRLRESTGDSIKQVDLAKACKVSRVAVSKWFKGGDVKARYIFLIADRCGVNPRWLATGEGPKQPAKAPELSDEARELAILYDQLAPQVRQNIADLLHTLTVPDTTARQPKLMATLLALCLPLAM
jgi:transcriptional regulator with XRE-family HTH domain